MYVLTDWSVGPASGPSENPYLAPEVAGIALAGKCPERAREVSRTGNPDHEVTTSRVVSYDPATRVAKTASGSEYRLDGPPSAEYAAWCARNGFDPVLVVR